MKTIEPVSIWDNGTVQEAVILNSYATNVTLNTSATFWYGLFTETAEGFQGLQVAQGNLTMTGDAYAQWQTDNYAWDWIAQQLNLTITGEFIPPVPTTTTTTTTEVPEPTTSTTTTSAPSTTSTTSTVK
jgi:hypothetical protein